jgi:hypothetical protein
MLDRDDEADIDVADRSQKAKYSLGSSGIDSGAR